VSNLDYDNADPRQSCYRKKAYPTEQIGQKVVNQMKYERGADVVTYGCRHCGRWHIGRAPGSTR
jgi:hypothetical protein